jgi:hypothetical protein
MRNYFFIYMLYLACFCGCFVKVYKREKKLFKTNNWCYVDRDRNQSADKLWYDGYYSSRNYNCIFYPDGLWVGGFVKGSRSENGMKGDRPYGISLWGMYRITEDTIKIKYLNAPQRPYVTWSVWFLLESNGGLKQIINTPTQPITDAMLQLEQRKFPDGQKFTFVPSDSLPDMNKSWFKRQKWLWCDKEAYETWMASQKPMK